MKNEIPFSFKTCGALYLIPTIKVCSCGSSQQYPSLKIFSYIHVYLFYRDVDPVMELLIHFSIVSNNASDDIPTKTWDHVCSQLEMQGFIIISMGRKIPYFEVFDNWFLSPKFNSNNLRLLTCKYFLCLFSCCSVLQHKMRVMEYVLGIIDGAAMRSKISSPILMGFMALYLSNLF